MASLYVRDEAALVKCWWRVKESPNAELGQTVCCHQTLLLAARLPEAAWFAAEEEKPLSAKSLPLC